MLFTPFTLRGATLRNRIMVSPMCQYSAQDGFSTDWHLVHLGARAVGGAGLVMAEATAVEPRGRISPHDLGIWKDEHVPGLERITQFIAAQGALPGIQLAHAGRKASVSAPWEGDAALGPSQGGWTVVGPSPVAFSPKLLVPEELTADGVQEIVASFGAAAQRARAAGFRAVELHFAHGYLVNEFLSPLSNHRTDRYGGSFENRARLAREIARAVRAVLPQEMPLFARLSVTEWTEGGWDVKQSVELARCLKEDGVDLIDCSSGGNVAGAKTAIGPGYQTVLAEQVRRGAAMPTAAVGLITSAAQADHVLRTGQADIVVM
ncbi:MAG TPA: NADH:flavin oxidoreductase/NADH oxidase, partial [bacterium]|nr:NADH:flavin oxidoreductase/NADH oxidase [bacterium]